MADSAELVIFDCDGVLIDSGRLAVKVDVQVLGALGWPLSEAEVIERFMGRSDREARATIQAHLGRAPPDEWQRGKPAPDLFLHDMRELPRLLDEDV
jgi:beta-phosphoglucomutase-like phosphatase (HAD superfamily)